MAEAVAPPAPLREKGRRHEQGGQCKNRATAEALTTRESGSHRGDDTSEFRSGPEKKKGRGKEKGSGVIVSPHSQSLRPAARARKLGERPSASRHCRVSKFNPNRTRLCLPRPPWPATSQPVPPARTSSPNHFFITIPSPTDTPAILPPQNHPQHPNDELPITLPAPRAPPPSARQPATTRLRFNHLTN